MIYNAPCKIWNLHIESNVAHMVGRFYTYAYCLYETSKPLQASFPSHQNRRRLYTWVCAKWQWNARNCVTGLHDRRSRGCNPVTLVECVSLSFRTHPGVLAALVSHTYCVQTELRLRLPNEFDIKKVFYSLNLLFVPLRCWILVKHAI